METTFTIRQAKQTDAAVFGDLWGAFLGEQSALDERLEVAEDARERWDNDYPVWLRDTTRRLAVAETDTGVVGFVTAQLWSAPPIYAFRPEVYLTELYVDPSHRRGGIASALVEHVKAWGAEMKAEQIRFSTLVENALGIDFWEKQGATWFSKEALLPLETPLREEKEESRGGKLGF